MIGTLVKTADVDAGDRRCTVQYYEVRTVRGARRYTAQIVLAPDDRIIIDDDSLAGLESRVAWLVPATVQSRRLAKRPQTHTAA